MSTDVALILLAVVLALLISVALVLQHVPRRSTEAEPPPEGVESELLRRPLRSRQNA